jgi:MOSC domain-containing protein YiiM
MHMNPTLISIQVGLPQTRGRDDAADPMDRTWTSGFFKEPVHGPVMVTWDGVAGDGQADRENHGGPDKAILAYSADHYEDWKRDLQVETMPFGAFGENLSIRHLSESNVCIGDVWELGPCVFEVSQPRQPCWKLARRWRIKQLPSMVVANGRSGWYFRIRNIGTIHAGMEFTLRERPHAEWTIQRANQVLYHMKHDRNATTELLHVAALSFSWKELLRQRL